MAEWHPRKYEHAWDRDGRENQFTKKTGEWRGIFKTS